MTDPYNNNPFANDTSEVSNEHDANRELARTAHAKQISKDLMIVINDITEVYKLELEK